MALRVLKFGGSSLATLEHIEQVAERIASAHRAGDRLVVVCSAMGRATDDLLRLAHSTAPGVRGRELDMLVTAGERVSAALLSLRLGHIGIASWSLTGSQSGIVTDDAHGSARIVAVRPHRVRQGLESGRVVVVAGFQGVSERGEVTALGRGGSDTTAVALAAALGADACEIYSDVAGVFAADPRLVADARHLPAVDLEAMQALAEGGAKVLAAEAVAFARGAGIAIDAGLARDGRLSTRLVPSWRPAASPLAAVASCRARCRPAPSLLAAGGGAPSAREGLLWQTSEEQWTRPLDACPPGAGEREAAWLTLVGRPAVAPLLAAAWRALAPLPAARFVGADAWRAWFVVAPAAEAEAVQRVHAATGPAAS